MFELQSAIWLLLGGLLAVFGFGKRTVPLAPWLSLLFLLHFSRTNSPLIGFFGVWLAWFLAVAIANRGVIKLPTPIFFGVVVLISATNSLPFIADRLLAPHLPGLVSTLVFPLTFVVVEWVSGRLNPFGTWGSQAYTQYGNLPLMQLASVTGLWGITFLVAWFGSVGNWVWMNGFAWESIQTEVLAYGATWALVMLGGGLRLALSPDHAPTVRVAGIGWPADALDRGALYPLGQDDNLTDEALQNGREKLHELHARLLDDSRREARAGAKIVAWPETSTVWLAEDTERWVGEAQQVAKEEGIYLLMGAAVINRQRSQPRWDNLALLVTPQGETAYVYRKSRDIPPDAAITLLKDEGIPATDTPYGRIAAAICFVLDFPGDMRQVGRKRADLLLAPYGDWETIKELHANMAAFRAVENGVSLVRPARGGLSTAVDPYGRELARMDEFTADQRVMVAQVPVSGVRTIYSRFGDWFAWLSMAGLLVLCGVAFIQGSI